MKILCIAQYFPPEIGALATRASELARHWAEMGHDVTVLTGFPNYPSGEVPMAYRRKIRRLVYKERKDGYRVVRTWLSTFSNSTSLQRMIGYLSFMVSTSLTGSLLSKPDLVIASSPPLTVGLAGWVIGKLKRIPFFFEVRDLWPDSITASGVSKKKSFLIRSLRILSIFLYRNCDHIVVVSPAFKEEIVENWDIPREKISIITNGVETSRFKPNCSIGAINQRFDLSGKFIVSYIGNFGWAQGLRTVVEAAAHLQHDHPDIVFLFVGAGADKEKLEDLVREKNLSNVRFVSQQPREKIPGFICASEICLVPLRKADVFQTVIPSKIFEFMACARPIILSVKGQARQILEQAGAGRCVEPENALALSQAILDLYHRPEARKEMGEDGRRHVVENFSRKRLAEKYLECLEHVLK